MSGLEDDPSSEPPNAPPAWAAPGSPASSRTASRRPGARDSPPTWQQPPAYTPYPVGGPPGYAPYPVGGPPAPGMLGAAHKPGAMPLRPLGLGDIFDAAFRIIRFNPKATVGAAVLVSAVAMVIPVLAAALLAGSVDLSAASTSSEIGAGEVAGIVGSLGALGAGLILQSLGTLLVTGMIAHITAAAAVGRRLSLGEAWAATHGKRWRLIGLSLLLGALVLVALLGYVGLWILVVVVGDGAVIVVWGVLTVPLFIAVMAWFWIRVYYLPVPALMLEDVSITGAIARGFRLTRRQFWRTFGIALLTVIVAGIAGQILAIPASVLGQVLAVVLGERYVVLTLVLTQAVSSVLSSAFVTPFTAAVTSLQYVDQRMRKEAFDVELMERAGITAS